MVIVGFSLDLKIKFIIKNHSNHERFKKQKSSHTIHRRL